MPGFVGFVASASSAQDRAFAEALSAFASPHIVESLVDAAGDWGLGRVHLGVFDSAPHLVAGRAVQAAVAGEFETLAGDSAGVPTTKDSQASSIIELYELFGPKGLRRVRGAFSAAVIDTERKSAVLVSDRLGSYPLYYAVHEGAFIFASSLKVLLRLRGDPPALDPRAIADYLSFGFVTGTRTLAGGVAMLEPGCILRWNARDGLSLDRYAPTLNLFTRREQSHERYVRNVVDAFGSAVQRAATAPGPVGMSLSGGLDSRAILSALPSHSELETYTLGVAGCADEVIARQLCTFTGARFTFFELDDHYLTGFLDHFRQMVALTDGMYLSHGLTEMLALGFLEAATFRVLLRGHCGELAKTSLAWPVHTDQHVFEMRTARQLIDHLLRRYAEISGGVAWLDVFTPPWRSAMEGAAQASLEEALDDVDLSPPELCSYLYLREHQRRFTVPSLELFRHAVEIRLPFVDQDFLQALLSGLPEWHHSTELHRAIVTRYDRRLLAVRDSNTGARMDAGRLSSLVGGKLDAIYKRLDLWGHRHYHSFERWMAKMLVESVESQLLSARSLDRGLLVPERLRALLESARRGERGSAYVLQVLLILELWQQENVDAYEPAPVQAPIPMPVAAADMRLVNR